MLNIAIFGSNSQISKDLIEIVKFENIYLRIVCKNSELLLEWLKFKNKKKLF